MKRASVSLLLIMVILTVTTPIVLARSGQKMDLVCFVKPAGGEQSAYFLMTGSGIVHRWKEDDGQHDIYKPVSKFDMPGEGGWVLWQAKAHAPCATPSPVSIGQYLVPDDWYWHKHN